MNHHSDGKYWISNATMTVGVRVSGGRITLAAPVIRRFRGQSINNLLQWMNRKDRTVVLMLEPPKKSQ